MSNEKVSRTRTSTKSKVSPKVVVFEEAEKLAHNIKAPLTALKYLLNRQVKMDLPDEQKKLLSLAVSRLSSLSNRFLKSRQETGAELKRIEIPTFKAIIQESLLESGAIQELSRGHRTPEVVFYDFTKVQKLILSPDKTFVTVDPGELKNVLFTLFDNCFEAFKRDIAKPIVKISCFLINNSLVLEIQDNGCGIEKNDLQNIGEKYFSSQKESGNGLGLFFAKQAIGQWGGDLDIRSESGTGTTATMTLPIQKISLH